MLRVLSEYRHTLRCDHSHEHVSLRFSVESVDLESDIGFLQVWINSMNFVIF